MPVYHPGILQPQPPRRIRFRMLLPSAMVTVVIAVVGTVLLQGALVALPAVTLEVERAVPASGNGARVVRDNAASGSKALGFGPVTSGGNDSGQCRTSSNLAVQDSVEQDDTPWQMTGDELNIVFSTYGITEPWAGYVGEAAAIWSASPCINATASADPCGAQPCVPVGLEGGNQGGDFGITNWETMDGYLTGSDMTIFMDAHEGYPESEKLSTIAHEMGHALGLAHRGTQNILMSATPAESGSTTTQPDAVDFQNLLALYGTQQTGGQ
ncbi:matrixin family metalloprotease [Candidatus Saccharibacteria bacterium]|nr:matrixin family metalloprotease [Candidatus Saccharibacteria bacterium]